MVKILVEAKLDYLLDNLVAGDLRAFMQERVQYYFREVRGYKYDEVNAVLASGVSTLADVEARLAALASVRPTEDFEPLAAACKRIRNILKQAAFRGRRPLWIRRFSKPVRSAISRIVFTSFTMAGEGDFCQRG